MITLVTGLPTLLRKQLSPPMLWHSTVLRRQQRYAGKFTRVTMTKGVARTLKEGRPWAETKGDRGSGPSLKNHKNIGFLSNTGPDPKKWQSYQASIQCRVIIGTPAKRHLNGVSLAGRWWPAYSGIWMFPLLIKLKNVVIVGPPLTKLSRSTIGRLFRWAVVCVHSAPFQNRVLLKEIICSWRIISFKRSPLLMRSLNV